MSDIPRPVLLNCWKHHAGYIRDRIKQADENSLSELIKQIKVIGDGLMDLYYGNMSPGEISRFILSEIKPDITKEGYLEWIKNSGKDFRILSINDGSVWTLRYSENDERFIHIHPGRYSPLTLRVKASTLKTAITAAGWKIIHNQEPDLKIINLLRTEYLSLSPVKDKYSIPAILKILYFLTS